MKNLESLGVEKLDSQTLKTVNAGDGGIWVGVLIGYIASEIAQGVYQAQQKGFTCTPDSSC